MPPGKPFFMSHINIEIKARTDRADDIRRYLIEHKADYRGADLQVDTYFKVAVGRLKLREGKIENNLIYYNRENITGPKQSDFELFKIDNGSLLKSMLTKALGIKVVVQKTREIYYIGNVKFHVDTLEGLGSFVEIEASNLHVNISTEELREQCDAYMREFRIDERDLIAISYSDMLIALGG